VSACSGADSFVLIIGCCELVCLVRRDPNSLTGQCDSMKIPYFWHPTATDQKVRDADPKSGADPEVEAIVKQLRQEINNRRKELSPAPVAPGSDPMSADFATLEANCDVYDVWFNAHRPSNRHLLGRLIIRIKEVIRYFLNPSLVRQVRYNEANVRIATYLNRRLASLTDSAQGKGELEQDLQQLHADLEALKQATEREIAAGQDRLETFERQLEYQQKFLSERLQYHAETLCGAKQLAGGASQQSIAELNLNQDRLSQAEPKVHRLIDTFGDGQQSSDNLDDKKGLLAQDIGPAFDHFRLEAYFRGSGDQIKARQKVYIPIFAGHEPVLDVRCGSGEFLELLRESRITSRGVDLDSEMLLLCRDKGLDVARADALEELASHPDESLGGIFSAQVIEHLEPVEISKLLSLCFQKLKPGGVLLLETLNPESLMVHYKWICIDLSLKRLVHPETLEFLLMSIGFRDIGKPSLSPVDRSKSIPRLDFQDLPVAESVRFNQATEWVNILLHANTHYAMSASK
jgi:SAM-dependent methyltransferase